jgi:hypothetical protein
MRLLLTRLSPNSINNPIPSLSQNKYKTYLSASNQCQVENFLLRGWFSNTAKIVCIFTMKLVNQLTWISVFFHYRKIFAFFVSLGRIFPAQHSEMRQCHDVAFSQRAAALQLAQCWNRKSARSFCTLVPECRVHFSNQSPFPDWNWAFDVKEGTREAPRASAYAIHQIKKKLFPPSTLRSHSCIFRPSFACAPSHSHYPGCIDNMCCAKTL